MLDVTRWERRKEDLISQFSRKTFTTKFDNLHKTSRLYHQDNLDSLLLLINLTE